jgi:hypothetical protein
MDGGVGEDTVYWYDADDYDHFYDVNEDRDCGCTCG